MLLHSLFVLVSSAVPNFWNSVWSPVVSRNRGDRVGDGGLSFVVRPLRHFKYQTAKQTSPKTSIGTTTTNAVFQKLFSGQWVTGEVDTVMVVVSPLAPSGSSNCGWSDRSPWGVSVHWSLSLHPKSKRWACSTPNKQTEQLLAWSKSCFGQRLETLFVSAPVIPVSSAAVLFLRSSDNPCFTSTTIPLCLSVYCLSRMNGTASEVKFWLCSDPW